MAVIDPQGIEDGISQGSSHICGQTEHMNDLYKTDTQNFDAVVNDRDFTNISLYNSIQNSLSEIACSGEYWYVSNNQTFYK